MPRILDQDHAIYSGEVNTSQQLLMCQCAMVEM